MTMTLDDVRSLAGAIRAEIAKAIVGQEDMVDMLLTALLAEGHVLLEGPPEPPRPFLRKALRPRWASISGAFSLRPTCCRAIFWGRTCSTSRPASSR